MPRPDATPNSKNSQPEPAERILERFEGRGVTLVAKAGEFSINLGSGKDIDSYTHVNVEIADGAVPDKFLCYFEDGSSKCLNVRIYNLIKQSVAPDITVKAS